MNYQQMYEEGKRILAGVPDGGLDARLLLEAVCHTRAADLLGHPERPVSPEEEALYRSLLERRAGREPLAYITGEQDFMGLSFAVTHDVLIPGPDTENLVEEAMRLITDGTRILDLCTGSGCILLSLLSYSNGSTGIGTDLSGPALEVARGNADRLGLTDRVLFLEGDLFEALKDRGEPPFELIISNPPYIRPDVIETLEPEVRCHEPRMALDGGEDGLDFYRRIAEDAIPHLCVSGLLILEIGYDQGEAVRQILEEKGYHDVEILQDYAGLDRVACGVRSLGQGTDRV